MPNTSVHFPGDVLHELDRAAQSRGVSRNRLIVEACRAALQASRKWPEAFFSNEHLTQRELRDLRAGALEFAETLASSRRNRRKAPLP